MLNSNNETEYTDVKNNKYGKHDENEVIKEIIVNALNMHEPDDIEVAGVFLSMLHRSFTSRALEDGKSCSEGNEDFFRYVKENLKIPNTSEAALFVADENNHNSIMADLFVGARCHDRMNLPRIILADFHPLHERSNLERLMKVIEDSVEK